MRIETKQSMFLNKEENYNLRLVVKSISILKFLITLFTQVQITRTVSSTQRKANLQSDYLC